MAVVWLFVFMTITYKPLHSYLLAWEIQFFFAAQVSVLAFTNSYLISLAQDFHKGISLTLYLLLAPNFYSIPVCFMRPERLGGSVGKGNGLGCSENDLDSDPTADTVWPQTCSLTSALSIVMCG